jgi:hypothetical protein
MNGIISQTHRYLLPDLVNATISPDLFKVVSAIGEPERKGTEDID